MSYLIRPRSSGRSFELRIKHKLLPKPYYRTFDSEAEARAFAETAERLLASGTVPEGFKAAPHVAFVDLAGAIAAILEPARFR